MSITISGRLSQLEYQGFLRLCRKHNVSRQQMIRALIVDALVDEGIKLLEAEDDLRREQSERREGCGEGIETSRPTA